MKTVRIAAVLALAALPVAFAASAEAYVCKNNYTTVYTNGQTKAYGIKKWSKTVKSKYGLEWSVWDIAASKSQDCVSVGSGRYKCTTKAKACQYVVP